jgi:hypothetical protein
MVVRKGRNQRVGRQLLGHGSHTCYMDLIAILGDINGFNIGGNLPYMSEEPDI